MASLLRMMHKKDKSCAEPSCDNVRVTSLQLEILGVYVTTWDLNGDD